MTLQDEIFSLLNQHIDWNNNDDPNGFVEAMKALIKKQAVEFTSHCFDSVRDFSNINLQMEYDEFEIKNK